MWKIITGAPPELADLILSSLETPFDFLYVDDINGRTCLHEAAISGSLRSIDICLEKGVQVEKTDVYGRTALHYACMKGHADVCRRLVAAKAAVDVLDMDNYNALIYATLGGSVDCLKVLLEEESVADQLVAPSGDLIPAIACKSSWTYRCRHVTAPARCNMYAEQQWRVSHAPRGQGRACRRLPTSSSPNWLGHS